MSMELKQALDDIARRARKAIELMPPDLDSPADFQGEFREPPTIPAHQLRRIRSALRGVSDVIGECLGNRSD